MNPTLVLITAVLISPIVALCTFLIQLVYAVYFSLMAMWEFPNDWYNESKREQMERQQEEAGE